jgi:hypothetical protein
MVEPRPGSAAGSAIATSNSPSPWRLGTINLPPSDEAGCMKVMHHNPLPVSSVTLFADQNATELRKAAYSRKSVHHLAPIHLPTSRTNVGIADTQYRRNPLPRNFFFIAKRQEWIFE